MLDAAIYNNYLDGPFKNQIKYVLVTDHSHQHPVCGSMYCVGTLSGATAEFEPVSSYFKFSDPEQGAIIESRLKDMQGPVYHNSGDILLILKAEGNVAPPEVSAGYYWLDSDLFEPAPIVGVHATVHGSISRYESNIVFVLFYPYNSGSPINYQPKLNSFINGPDSHYDQRENLGYKFRLSTGHANFFEKLLTHSNQLFMSRP